MKRALLLLTILFSFLSYGQNKIATLNYGEIYNSSPKLPGINQALNVYAGELMNQTQPKQVELDSLIDLAERYTEYGLTEEEVLSVYGEAEKLSNEISSIKDELKKQYDQKWTELNQPIIDEMDEAIKEYCEQEGIALVLQEVNLAGERLLVYNAYKNDITPIIKARLQYGKVGYMVPDFGEVNRFYTLRWNAFYKYNNDYDAMESKLVEYSDLLITDYTKMQDELMKKTEDLRKAQSGSGNEEAIHSLNNEIQVLKQEINTFENQFENLVAIKRNELLVSVDKPYKDALAQLCKQQGVPFVFNLDASGGIGAVPYVFQISSFINQQVIDIAIGVTPKLEETHPINKPNFAVVNGSELMAALMKTDDLVEMAAKSEEKQKTLSVEVTRLEDELMALYEKLGIASNDLEKENLNQEILKVKRSYNTQMMLYEKERGAVQENLDWKVKSMIKVLAKHKTLDFVLNETGAKNVVYVDPTMDITSELLDHIGKL